VERRPPFSARLRRAVQQAWENKYPLQRMISRSSDWLLKFQGAPLAIIGIMGLNDATATQIVSTFEEYFLLFVLVFVLPHLIVVISFCAATFVRFLETFAPPPSRLTAGILTDESTRAFATTHDPSAFVLGGAIELLRHPFLDKDISNNGWHPSAVEIRLLRSPFPLPPELERPFEAKGDDNPKYSLVKASRPTTDDFKSLKLEVSATTYYQIEAVRSITDNDRTLRHKFSNVAPEFHRIPNSLCLHGILVFRDGNVLAMKRRAEAAYFPGAISVSFEEQLAQADFTSSNGDIAGNLFRRAICEEVFPLADRYERNPAQAWNEVSRFVDHYRFWSLAHEESVGNFYLFGVCKLSIDLHEYIREFRRIQEQGSHRDNEGKLYFMSEQNIRDYLRSGSGVVKVIDFSSSGAIVSEPIASVHPTMAYRCSTLLSCLA